MQRVQQAGSMIILILILLCSACSEYDKQAIHTLLDARDAAVTQHDIAAYQRLLISETYEQIQRKRQIVHKMQQRFKQFEKIEMQSSNRTIRLLDKQHAECEQSYLLRVFADGAWRQANERERLQLSKTDSGWKISGGL